MMLYQYRKDLLEYQFHPFIWDVGGKYVYPDDINKTRYHYPRGFEDCFEEEQNIPFRSML
jgi:L-ascorbate 6-phosphate lactonase